MLKVAAFHIKRLKPWLLKSTAAMWDSNGHGEKGKYGNLMKTILNANGGGGRRQIRQIISLKFGTCPKLQTTVPNWMIPHASDNTVQDQNSPSLSIPKNDRKWRLSFFPTCKAGFFY